MKKRRGGVANCWELSGGKWRSADAIIYITPPPSQVLTVITENADPSLVTQGLVNDKPCLVTAHQSVHNYS